jgi:DNA processing protein
MQNALEITSSTRLLTWLALWRSPKIGPKRFQAVLDQLLNTNSGFNHTQNLLNLIKSLNIPLDWNGAKQDLAWRDQNPHKRAIILKIDPDYPKLLLEIPDPPPVLFIQGNLHAWKEWVSAKNINLAIVGSRAPSRYGLKITEKFARELTEKNITIVSGLAQGIDATAHWTVLEMQKFTIAVLAHGLDTIYPKQNIELAKRMTETGVLLTEYPIGVQPRAQLFPRRNRLISGLSHGTLVIEAGLKSGSLITAKLATEQNREVFAIPGSIDSDYSLGCHVLIQMGAKLTFQVSDILQELGYSEVLISEPIENNLVDSGNPDKLAILSCLSETAKPMGIELIISKTNLTPETVSCTLIELELNSLVRHTTKGYCLVSSLAEK